MKRKIKNLGASMYLVISEAEKYLGEKDLGIVWLKIIEDFVRFSGKRGLKTIELVSTSLFSGDLLISIADEIKERLSGFKEVTYHLPAGEINIAALHHQLRKTAILETQKHIDLCQKLGIKKVVIHPGEYASMMDVYSKLRELAKEIATESILEIFQYCQERKIELLVENLHHDEPLFQEPEEFQPLVKKGLGMCLDMVHAFVSGSDPLYFIKEFGNKIAEVHLTDGEWEDPTIHLPIGSGQVNCLAALDELQKRDFQGPVIIEVSSKGDLIKSQEYLKEKGYL